ncbi:MAG: M15 family metallopeptidase [Desulfobulbaceae bacterium]|nr:M15 family metallopeptidase [Desulfobulbaceae bacterium]
MLNSPLLSRINILLPILFFAQMVCGIHDIWAAESLDKPAHVTKSVEKITLDGIEYEIPPPWAGHQIQVQPFSFSDFGRIPFSYTVNDSKIYVLVSTHSPLLKMLRAANEQGIRLQVSSGYRSIAYQRSIFKRMISEGRTFDDIIRYVAPPGYSEHMLGIAVDFYPSNWRFASSEQYLWLTEHASDFGFRETYHKSNEMKMPWEAWHWSLIRETEKSLRE